MGKETKTYLELTKEIMDKSNILSEAGDIAAAILGTEDMREMDERMVAINALAYKLGEISKETTHIWLNAHTIWMAEKEKEYAGKTPEQELAELEDTAVDDLPFC